MQAHESERINRFIFLINNDILLLLQTIEDWRPAMIDCKKIQKMIVPFSKGELTLKAEEMFVKHLEQCQDCREEFEIYYIVEYGLNEAATKELSEKYKKYLHDYDFSGLVEEKLKDSENKIAEVKKFNHLLHMCLLFVNACMIMTVLIIAVIIYL